MNIQLYYILLLTIISNPSWSQGVGVGTTNPDSSALLEIKSISRGFLMPRLTTSQRNLIEDPVQGLMVFDTDKNTIYLFDGIQWFPMLFATTLNKLPPTPVVASDATEYDQFGGSIAIAGDYAVIGSVYKDFGGVFDTGGAYIFHRQNGIWMQQAFLAASNGATGDNFGVDVAISETGNVVVIGAIYGPGPNHADQGAAYIFSRSGTTWTQTAILTASDGDYFEKFGSSVSISGDYIGIGANYDNISGVYAVGSVYVFYKGAGWTTNQPHQDKLIASDFDLSDLFGSAISLYGDYIAIGSEDDDNEGFVDKGSAYIFGRIGTDWLQLAKLTASDGNDDDHYGSSISLYGDYVIIGTNIYENTTYSPAYIYHRGSGWTTGQAPQATLNMPDEVGYDLFGSDVALSSDYALIGSSFKNVASNNYQGAAYLFKRIGSTWNFVRRIDDETGQAFAYYGTSVSINGNNLGIGAIGKNSAKGEAQFLNIE